MDFDYSAARKHLLELKVCDRCFGRQFYRLFEGMDQGSIGSKIRQSETLAEARHKETDEVILKKDCPLCNGHFLETNDMAEKAIDLLENLDYNNFLVGCRVENELAGKEEEIWNTIGALHSEPLKKDLVRQIGLTISKSTGKDVDFQKPDITVIADFTTGKLSLEIHSLFIYGEYKKLVRGIPQTRWYCRKCRGRGCKHCDFTGKMYEESVEELIAKPLLDETGATGEKFHGCLHPLSQVVLADGSTLPMKKLAGCWEDKKILTYGSGLHETSIDDFVCFDCDGITTIELETKETGREIIASEDHIFYTSQGKKPLRLLKSGDLVAVLPYMDLKMGELKEVKLINSKDLKELTQRYFPKAHVNKHIKTLEKIGLLPLTTTNKNILVITRLLAFLFGDGNVHYTRNRDVSLSFYEKLENLKSIQNDLRRIGFKTSNIRERTSRSMVLDYYGKAKPISGRSYELTCNSKALWMLVVALGAPIGDKVKENVFVPRWVFNDELLKIEFLASLFGAEMSKPRLDKRKHNKKSFNSPIFSMNKIETNLENGIHFLEDIRRLLGELSIETGHIKKIPYTTRKDGNKSIKLRIDILNKQENLVKLYGIVGFRYSKEKEKLAKYAFEYLSMKKKVIEERKSILKKALKLKKNGKTLAEINKEIDYAPISRQHLWFYLNGKMKLENTKVPNSFPNYNNWVIKATNGLKDGLVWETVSRLTSAKATTLMDLTTKTNSHCFFANGFLVSNSGREDIDATMLGWRPFVLELQKPLLRFLDWEQTAKSINKHAEGKVEVKALRLSSKDEVRNLKAAKHDKTYEAIIECEQKPKNLKQIEKEFKQKEIEQRTPQRVSHRRADLVRKKVIYKVRLERSGKNLKAIIKAEAGAYIKELISGDDGRTKPSFADFLGPCKCIELNVLEVHKND